MVEAVQHEKTEGGVRYITSDFAHKVTFSVCSLVASQEKYDRLLTSFRAHGFTDENSEFLAADNRTSNDFDGFTWMRRLYPECRGKYIIFCHDDVELIDDGYDEALAALQSLDKDQPSWLLAGNAGGRIGWQRLPRRSQRALSISDPYSESRVGPDAVEVETLDENLMIMRRDRFVCGSVDLKGFHMYGSDLCLMADVLGGKSFVINFHLKHHGRGSKDAAFHQSRVEFGQKYGRFYPDRTLLATTGHIKLAMN